MKNSNHEGSQVGSIFIVTAGIFTAAIGLLALLGWIVQIPTLTTFGANSIPLAPSTALLFILLGVALSVHNLVLRNRRAYMMSMVIGATVMVTASLLFVSSSAGIYSSIEHPGLSITDVAIGHMSPVTAACFAISALSFILTLSSSLLHPKRGALAFACAFLMAVISLLLLIAYLFGSPILYGSKIIPPSLPASVAFFILALGLLLSAALRIWSYDKIRNAASDRDSFALFIILIFSAAGIVAGGYLYFKNYENQYRAEVEQRLSAIAELKTDQLVEWRKERYNDGEMIFRNYSFTKLVQQYFESSANKDAQHQLEAWLGKFQSQDEYDRVFLLDTRGIPRISVPSEGVPLASTISDRVSKRLFPDSVTMVEFHKNEHNQKIYYSILVPILDEQRKNRYLGALVMEVDPTVFLYPFIQSWPTATRTSETLIIRREGNDALFLNDLRFDNDAALNHRIPSENKDVLAVKAVLGEKGIVEGTDYRGERVIGYICAVPHSDWYLIARMDIEEVYAALRERLWLIEVLVLALLAVATAGIGLVWRHQRNSFYREQYKSSEALRNSENRYRSLFENMNEGYAYCKMLFNNDTPEDFIYIDVNPAFESITGLKNVAGKKVSEAIPGIQKSNPELLEIYGRVALGGHPETFETCVESLGIWFSIAVYCPAKEYFVAVFNDITERKRAEEKVENLAAIVQASYDAIIGKNLDGIITSWNEGAERLYGFTESEMIGKPISLLIPAEREDELPAILESIRSGKHIEHYETRRSRKDGQEIHVSLSVSPIRDAGGKIIGASSIARDITRQQRAEEKIQKLNAELETRVIERTARLEVANKELDAFAYSVSHDLRAPLRSIDGFSQILLEDYAQKLDEKGTDSLQRVRAATQRMGQLIDDLLGLSRVSRSALSREFVDLSAIAAGIAAELRESDPGRAVEFAISPEMKVIGDAHLLRIVIDNLIRNAFKFTSKHAKARVEFGMAEREGTKVYYVRDDGAGFDMKYANKMFGAFQRMHSLVEFPGTGIGLATVQRIINRLGGRVWAESEVEKGATFYFTLQ